MNKNELIKSMVNTFKDIMSEANLTWDIAYFRFGISSENSHSSSWAYLADKSLKNANPADMKQEDNYFSTLANQSKQLFELILEETESAYKPLVLVLEINNQGGFKITFNAVDGNSMSLSILDTESENSYFYNKKSPAI